jgi:hypothetical protein
MLDTEHLHEQLRLRFRAWMTRPDESVNQVRKAPDVELADIALDVLREQLDFPTTQLPKFVGAPISEPAPGEPVQIEQIALRERVNAIEAFLLQLVHGNRFDNWPSWGAIDGAWAAYMRVARTAQEADEE